MSTTGMGATSGKALVGLDHLKQSIRDIVTTRIGTRVMRRDYGADIPNIVDRPVNEELAVDLTIALADALGRWEPRFRLRDVAFRVVGEGVIEFSLTGDYLPDGRKITLEEIVFQ